MISRSPCPSQSERIGAAKSPSCGSRENSRGMRGDSSGTTPSAGSTGQPAARCRRRPRHRASRSEVAATIQRLPSWSRSPTATLIGTGSWPGLTPDQPPGFSTTVGSVVTGKPESSLPVAGSSACTKPSVVAEDELDDARGPRGRRAQADSHRPREAVAGRRTRRSVTARAGATVPDAARKARDRVGVVVHRDRTALLAGERHTGLRS
jgi:hypothetical protein